MTTIHKIVPAFLLVLFLCFLPVADCFADAPSRLNYQGIITDSVGQPVTGQKTILFSLYSEANGGTAFWSETQSVPLDSNGRFSATLGINTPLNKDQFTGTTFLGIKIGEDPELAPRQQLTSVAYALQTAAGVPTGGIIMWSGSAAEVPAGWVLCDGAEKTLPDGSKIIPPNLKDKFIVGAGGSYQIGHSGGSATKDLSHFHTGPSHSHTLPGHTHRFDHDHYVSRVNDGSWESENGGGMEVGGDYAGHTGFDNADVKITQAGGAGNTGTSGTANTGTSGSTSQDILPPFYALAFIMKL